MKQKSIQTKYGIVGISENGYPRITSRKEGNKNKFLHRLIYEDEFGEIPDNCCVHHIDGNKLNWNIKNLQCITKEFHDYLHFRNKNGENHYRSKFTANDVVKIRLLKKQGKLRLKVFKCIAKPRGITLSGFNHVWYSRTWKGIKV